MKLSLLLQPNVILTSMCLFLMGILLHAQSNKDYTVQTRVVVANSPPSISIRWAKIPSGVTSFIVYRKSKDEQDWGTIKGTVSGTDTIWTDTNVEVGKVYEYNIQKLNGTTLLGVTYLLCGIEVPVVHNRGTALIVVEKDLAASLQVELHNYMMDIAADGWQVFSIHVSKTDSVQFVKREINRFEKMHGGINSLILLGHIPVPYSGNFGRDSTYIYPPDGHIEHNGCWPADVYYAVDYDKWTDTLTNTDATRAENKNLPGDGKFDITRIPGSVKYFMGRIDLSNLPLFDLSEVELTKQYIKKAHDFRYHITKTVEKGVVDDRFEVTYGANGSLAWRNYTAMFGPNSIIEGDFLQNCDAQNLLFAFGAHGGTYTNCGRVCSSNSFLEHKGAIFNMLFGSNFGDWDNENNLLRAPLAAKENGLTNAWSARPHWQNHAMALGETIGFCTRLTQNNVNTYTYNYAANAVHIALMGDPTLRLHIISPPDSIVARDTANKTKVNLNWPASNDPDILGYYVYNSKSPYGTYQLLNSTPLTTTSFTDNIPFQGTNYYLVKTVKLTTSASGSYYNTSYGTSVVISGITGKSTSVQSNIVPTVSCYPNPAAHTLSINFPNAFLANNNEVRYTISTTCGQQVLTFQSNQEHVTIPLQTIASGTYYLTIQSGLYHSVDLFVVIK